MLLEKKLNIPGLKISKFDVNATSYIALNMDYGEKDGPYCLDFIHNVPNDKNTLVDVECILTDSSALKLTIIGQEIANFFNIPFVENVFIHNLESFNKKYALEKLYHCEISGKIDNE